MILLTVDQLTKHYGPEPVLSGVTFELRRGDKIGLVGPNGAGKSTLLRIIAGQLEPDAGSAHRHGSTRSGYLQQQPEFRQNQRVWDVAQAALAHLVEMVREAEQVARDMALVTSEADRTRLEQKYDRLQHDLELHEAYHLDHRIERILAGLGFTDSQYEQPVQQLSGGQQNRLLLAQLLLAEPDVMLLDEPSNHLDVEASEWLEAFLAASHQAFIVVSHDRYFLDKVTTRTLELFHGTVDDYRGNFSAYWRQKAERLEIEKRTYERQQDEIAKLKDFVRRNQYGQKHAQAKDRQRKLERIESVALPREIATPSMRFPPASRTGDIVVRVEGISKSYDQPLFRDLTFEIERGQRWGILGGNGTGKTTLLRSILGEVAPDEGQIQLGAGVAFGYYDQQLDCVDDQQPVVDAIRPSGKEFVEQQRRDLLARFGVSGEMAFQRVGSLSGGERSRAALAKLAASDPNMLIFDEPTNHLDLWACDALENALRQFDGTALLVSHDRYFLNRVVDHLLVVEPGRFRVVEGNYDFYLHLQRQGLASSTAEQATRPESQKSTIVPKDTRRKRKFPYRKLAEIEAEIEQRESHIEEWHRQLTDPDVLRSGPRVKQIQADIAAAQTELEELYAHWEEAAERN